MLLVLIRHASQSLSLPSPHPPPHTHTHIHNAVAPALANAAAPAAATCDAAGIAAAALAPPGGLKGDWILTPSPRWLFFQVLADFTYAKDFVAGTRRKDVTPCLTAWGAKHVARVTVESPFGADVSALMVATDAAVIVSFRGQDSRRDVSGMETITSPAYDAAYFGPRVVALVDAAKAPPKLANGRPNPDAFWTLEGYQEAFETIRVPIEAKVREWAKDLPAGFQTFYTGHSDGSQLAQLAALLHASQFGPERVGGVLLFGPSRVGSRGFAAVFDALLGGVTARYAYGRDPAGETHYTIADGLQFPGTGIYACPEQGKAVERLVIVPRGADRMNVCSELRSVDTPLSRLTLPTWVFGTDDPLVDRLVNWEYLAHHIPANTYDGLVRVLNAAGGDAKPDACTLAALGLSSCVVSTKCSAALRPAGASGCRGCASDATCRDYWGMASARCDRSLVELSGWQCFSAVPGTQLNLYVGKNGAPETLADVIPEMPRLRPAALQRNFQRLGR